MKRASYHNHTCFSDGADAPEVFVTHARAANLQVLGFSDHYYKESPTATTAPEWALQLDAVEQYFDTIAAVAERHPELEVRTGLEFDWLDGSAEWLRPLAQDARLDYTIGSVHFVGSDSIDLTRMFWEKLSADEVNDVIRRYWQTLRDMAASKLFDIAGHLDLYKKFGFYPTADMRDVITEALDAIRDADMAIELNTAGWRKDCKACYPTDELLQACLKREIPIVVSSDAHQAHLVAADFNRAYDILYRIGYTSLASFKQRERSLDPFTL
jgi:histidinol-phosphatase (PHP family)